MKKGFYVYMIWSEELLFGKKKPKIVGWQIICDKTLFLREFLTVTNAMEVKTPTDTYVSRIAMFITFIISLYCYILSPVSIQ